MKNINLLEDANKYIERQFIRDKGKAPTTCFTVSSIPQKIQEKKADTYIREFSPILYLLRIFGRLPFSRLPTGEFKFSVFSWAFLYCLIAYSLQTYIVILVCFQRIHDLQQDLTYNDIIFTVHVVVYLNIHFHLPVTFWIETPKIANYLNSWRKFQGRWKSLFGTPLQMRWRKATLWYTVVINPFVMGLLEYERHAVLNDPWVYFLPYYFTLASTFMVLCWWYVTCLELRRSAESAMTNLNEVLRDDPHIDFLVKWRLLWIELCKLSSTLGSTLSCVIISIFLTYTITFIFGAFSAISVTEFGEKFIGYLFSSTVSVSIIFAVCDAGHQASSQVSAKAKASIILTNTTGRPPEVKYQIDLIFKALEGEGPEIKLNDFVTINRPLFVSFASNVITYMIVLLQFRGSQNEGAPT